MVKYEDMSDFEINTKVALIKYRGLIQLESEGDGVFVSRVDDKYDFVNIMHSNFDPCNNPSDAWPIIVENRICVTSPTLCSKSNFWHASWNENGGKQLKGLIAFSAKNPLRAAMICFLKLTDATHD
ncbi:NinX [Vibrio phage 1.032.O._10N.261.54.F5]|nr:NinX [Vibrio phage 1.032.O._10N.261.54.F5]